MNKKIISLFLAFALLLNVSSVMATPADYNNTGEYLRDLGLISGDAEGNLNVEKNLTRAEAVVIILRMLGELEEAKNYSFYLSPFMDVPMDAWYAPYVIYAKDSGIVSGVSDIAFNPDGKVNSKQLASMFLRAAGYSANWGKEDIMAKARAYGLLNGLNAGDGSKDNSRGEAFVIFANAIELPMNPEKGEMTCVLAKILNENADRAALVAKRPRLARFVGDKYEPDYTFLGNESIVANVDKDKKEDKKEEDSKDSRIKFVEVKAEPNNPGHNVISLYFTQLMNFGKENLAGVKITDVRGEHSQYDKDWFMDRKNYTVGTTDKKVYIRYTDGAKVVPLDGMTFDIAYEVTMRDAKDVAKGNVTYAFGGSQNVKPDDNKPDDNKPESATVNEVIKINFSNTDKDTMFIKFSKDIKNSSEHLSEVYVSNVDFSSISSNNQWGMNGYREKSWYTNKSNYSIRADGDTLYIDYPDGSIYGEDVKITVHYDVEKSDSRDKAVGETEATFNKVIN